MRENRGDQASRRNAKTVKRNAEPLKFCRYDLAVNRSYQRSNEFIRRGQIPFHPNADRKFSDRSSADIPLRRS